MRPELNHSPDLRLTEIIAELFNRDFLADVEFIVETRLILAHSFVLMIRSPVFQSELEVTVISEKKSIPINDIKYDSVYQFVRFMYTDECDINGENALDLLKLAKRYKLIKLENLIIGSVNDWETNLSFFEHFLLENDQFQLHRFRADLQENLSDFLVCPRFLTLHPTAIEEILKFDCVKIPEFEMFEALTQWISQNGEANHIDASQYPIHYENLIRLIRFPVMTVEQIFACTKNYPAMFTDSDHGALFKIIANFPDKQNCLWNDQLRKIYEDRQVLVKYPKKEKFETKFFVYREMHLIGLEAGIAYNSADKNKNSITIAQKNAELGIIIKYTMKFVDTSAWNTNVINLGESLRLEPQMEYTIDFEYCTEGEDAHLVSRKDTTNLFTNISPDLIKFEKIVCNLFSLYFKLPSD